MRTNPFAALLFDVDNTLLDFDRSSKVAFRALLAEHSPESDFDTVFASFMSISHALWKRFEKGEIQRSFLKSSRFEHTFEEHQIDVDPAEFGRLYLEHVCGQVHFIEDAFEVCEQLYSFGIPMGLVTNGISKVQDQRLKNSGLDQFFQFTLCSNEKLRPKPFEDLFKAAWSSLGHPNKADVLMVGDNIVCDILGAQKFGFQGAWFNPKMKTSPQDICPKYTLSQLNKVIPMVAPAT